MQRTHVRPSAGHRQYVRSNTSNIYAKLHESKEKIKQKNLSSNWWFGMVYAYIEMGLEVSLKHIEKFYWYDERFAVNIGIL